MNDFSRRLLSTGPFLLPHPGGSIDLAVSVDDICHEQFRQLVGLVEQVRSTHASGSVLPGGKAGIGKSHLLARLRNAVRERESAYVCTVRPVVADEHSQLRNMAAAAVELLSHEGVGPWRRTPLFRMMLSAVQQAVGELPRSATPFRVGESLLALRSLMDRRANEGQGGHRDVERICSVLFRFFLAAERQPESQTACPAAALAIRWLELKPLRPDEGVQLGLRVVRKEGRPTPLVEMPSARCVLIVLAEPASLCGRALVACCDPIDECAAETAHALVGGASWLTSSERRLLMIFSGDRTAMTELRSEGMLQRPAARPPSLRKSGIMLGVVSREQSEKVLAARLRLCIEPFLTRPAVRLRCGIATDCFRWASTGGGRVRPAQSNSRCAIRSSGAANTGGHSWTNWAASVPTPGWRNSQRCAPTLASRNPRTPRPFPLNPASLTSTTAAPPRSRSAAGYSLLSSVGAHPQQRPIGRCALRCIGLRSNRRHVARRYIYLAAAPQFEQEQLLVSSRSSES